MVGESELEVKEEEREKERGESAIGSLRGHQFGLQSGGLVLTFEVSRRLKNLSKT